MSKNKKDFFSQLSSANWLLSNWLWHFEEKCLYSITQNSEATSKCFWRCPLSCLPFFLQLGSLELTNTFPELISSFVTHQTVRYQLVFNSSLSFLVHFSRWWSVYQRTGSLGWRGSRRCRSWSHSVATSPTWPAHCIAAVWVLLIWNGALPSKRLYKVLRIRLHI